MTDEEFADAMRRLPTAGNIDYISVQSSSGFNYYVDVVHTHGSRTFHTPLVDGLTSIEAGMLCIRTKRYVAALKRLTFSGS